MYRKVDPAPARAHLRKLREAGMTYDLIARLAGVSAEAVCRINTKRQRTIRRSTADAILSVRVELADTLKAVSPVGTRRRIEALACIGWTRKAVSARVGYHPESLTCSLYRGKISGHTALAVARVYEELQHTRGPSAVTATKALKRGWIAPAAWDDVDIDDPQARPNLTGYDEHTVRALMRGESVDATRQDETEAIVRLVAQGMRQVDVAELLGVSPSVVSSRLWRSAA
jgi:predicted transcriptional regulator